MAVASPMPELAPVTMTTVPSNALFMVRSLVLRFSVLWRRTCTWLRGFGTCRDRTTLIRCADECGSRWPARHPVAQPRVRRASAGDDRVFRHVHRGPGDARSSRGASLLDRRVDR